MREEIQKLLSIYICMWDTVKRVPGQTLVWLIPQQVRGETVLRVVGDISDSDGPISPAQWITSCWITMKNITSEITPPTSYQCDIQNLEPTPGSKQQQSQSKHGINSNTATVLGILWNNSVYAKKILFLSGLLDGVEGFLVCIIITM